MQKAESGRMVCDLNFYSLIITFYLTETENRSKDLEHRFYAYDLKVGRYAQFSKILNTLVHFL